MKCEYCDNPVPNDVTRCPSCGAAISMSDIRAVSVAQAQETFPSAFGQKVSSYTGVYTGAEPEELKNRWVYILLGIFLGEFGIHNFYAGYIGRGVVKLLITILSFGLLFWISWIWALVEICTVRIDSRGRPLVNQTI